MVRPEASGTVPLSASPFGHDNTAKCHENQTDLPLYVRQCKKKDQQAKHRQSRVDSQSIVHLGCHQIFRYPVWLCTTAISETVARSC